MGQPLRSITIVGGGTAGWLAAAFLNRFCKSKKAKHDLEITLIESPAIPIVGVGEASLPGMVVLLNQLGVSEAEFFKLTDATFKVAAHFINWNHDDKGRPIEFLNVLNAPSAIDGRQLADYFITFDAARAAPEAGLAYVRAFSPAVEIVRGNLAPRRPGEPDFSGELGYTYHFDATKLAPFLRDVATSRGVKHILDDVDAVNLDERGFVKSLTLRRQGEHAIDLVIDCTGFRGSILQQALGEPFEPYGDYLLNDRAAVVQIPHQEPRVIGTNNAGHRLLSRLEFPNPADDAHRNGLHLFQPVHLRRESRRGAARLLRRSSQGLRAAHHPDADRPCAQCLGQELRRAGPCQRLHRALGGDGYFHVGSGSALAASLFADAGFRTRTRNRV